MIKLDLHVHSSASKDSGLSNKQIEKFLTRGIIDCMAITDHDQIDNALRLKEKFDQRIIVGEEISTSQGHLIGLFLTKHIQKGLDIGKTIEEIKKQDGLVYIPHPMEKRRSGINLANLQPHIRDIDIVEVFNSRSFKPVKYSRLWSAQHSLAQAAASDSHGPRGIGSSYVDIASFPTRNNLIEQLNKGTMKTSRVALAYLEPSYYRLKKLF